MKRVVSVSLGSSKRNKKNTIELLGETFEVERVGTDGDMRKFQAMFEELDGKVDALGIGGADRYLVVGERRYSFREIDQCVRNVRKTPVVDGSGLKHTLERESIRFLSAQGLVDFKQERALLVSAVDRYGMAQELDAVCPDVIFADLYFGLGLPIPVRHYRGVEIIGRLLLPIITKLPFQWFYPTGEKQDQRTPKFEKLWSERTFLCGDSLYLLRYAPDRLDGKTILTQSIRAANIEFFRQAGVRRIITTTPVIGGETFATNVMEAVLVAHLGKSPDAITPQEMLQTLRAMHWSPNVIELQTEGSGV